MNPTRISPLLLLRALPGARKMRRLLQYRMRSFLLVALLCSGVGTGGVAVAADAVIAEGKDARGTIAYKGRTATLKYAWLIKGPLAMDPSKTVRRLIVSAVDIGAAMQACKTIMCADGQVTEGMTVDFDVGPRLNYWIALNGQKVQYSGTVKPDAFAVRANDATHLAGKLAIDDVAAGGPKIDAEFNVVLVQEFKQ